MELFDALPKQESVPSIRRARVISVAGRTLTVDLGGAKTIPSLDSCNPVPDQWVYIIGEGSSMVAIGALAGEFRQLTLVATASTTTTVTGVVNGVSRAVTKAGAFTVTNGDELPLLWGVDASEVWVMGKAGVPYVPPETGGGGGGGGGVTSGTATYAATWSGTYSDYGWRSGAARMEGDFGCFFYGSSRFRELQGRTITGFRINIVRQSGSGSLTAYAIAKAGPGGGIDSLGPSTVISPGGWRSLPISVANWMIAGSGTGAFACIGYGTLRGLPYGTLQFDWRK